MNSQYATRPSLGCVTQVLVLQVCRHAMKNYSYLVMDPATREAILVDPAWQMETFDQAIHDAQANLRGVLITHAHPDHTDLAKPLAAKYGCPIWMSKEEIADSGFHASQLVGLEPIPWTVGPMLIQPMLTPGHTPGGMCYLIGDNLFSGDVLFAEGCGLCPDMQAAHDLFRSLQTLKSRIPGRTRIFPGHSYGKPPGQTMWELLRENIYLQFPDQNSFAAFRLRKGQNPAKMFSFS